VTTKTLHFSVRGDDLTRLVRDLWVSEPECAIDVMRSAFPKMGDNDVLDVLSGRQRLDGVNDLRLLPDDAGKSWRGRPLPSPIEQIRKLVADVAHRDAALSEARDEIADATIGYAGKCASPWGLINIPRSVYLRTPSPSGWRDGVSVSWEEFEKRFPDLVEEAKDHRVETESAMLARGHWSKLQADTLTDPPSLPSATGVLDAILNRPTVCPKPDSTMTPLNGWLSPDGKFYPCGFMGHCNLAELLGKTEEQLERAWVKIQDSREPLCPFPRDNDFPHIPDRGVTQKQLDAIHRWCDVHGRKPPEDLTVR
jgi:hypothetical protein